MSAPSFTSAWTELRALARLSLPIALAQLGLVFMGLVDTAIIGHVSVEDLAATAIGRSIVFGVTSVGMGIGFALDPLASQAVGAGKPERAYQALRAGIQAAALVTLPTILIAFAVTLLLAPLGVDPAILPRVHAFMIGHVPGVFGFLAYLAGKSFLQAHGATRPALVASLVANLVNAVVCSLLVRGDDALIALGLPAIGLPRLGALGAGLASSIGSLLLAAIVLQAARSYRPVAPPAELPPSATAAAEPAPVTLTTVLRLGLPVGLQLLAEIGVFSLVALLAGRLGTTVLSAHQIAVGLASFTFMGALGVGGATAVRVGHAIGAGRSPRQSGLVGLGLGAVVMSVGAAVFAVIPRPLIAIFTKDAEVIEVGANLLRIASLFALFDGIQAVASGALRGAGDVRFPFLANVAAHWLVGLPVALLLGFGLGMGAPGLWWGLTAGLVTISVLLAVRFVQLSGR
ncbi:MAG: MATE family efflux transporter, partial [Byssovorax sp.]